MKNNSISKPNNNSTKSKQPHEANTTNSNNNNHTTTSNAHDLKKQFGDIVYKAEAKLKELAEKEAHWAEMEKRMEEHAEVASQKIILDIGGQRFATSKTTLLASQGSFFHAMLSSGKWKPDADGTYFIDRNPELFPVILDYLRMGKLSLAKYTYNVEADLKAELDFYQVKIPELQSTSFSGSSILEDAHKKILCEWLGYTTTILLYKASHDGFDAASFHKKCDDNGATLTVIQCSQGYIFGGFTNASWAGNGVYKNGTTPSWIFTIKNPYSLEKQFFPLHNDRNRGEIYSNRNWGPTFGQGNDIAVANYSNNNNHSYFEFPTTYKDTQGYGDNTFTGAQNFTTSEVEVFKIK